MIFFLFAALFSKELVLDLHAGVTLPSSIGGALEEIVQQRGVAGDDQHSVSRNCSGINSLCLMKSENSKMSSVIHRELSVNLTVMSKDEAAKTDNTVVKPILFINSFDHTQLASMANFVNWNELLNPTLDSPGIDYQENFKKIQSQIEKEMPEAVVFILSALFVDDVPLFSQYISNQMKYFFELLQFLDAFKETKVILVTPWPDSFKSIVELTWSRSFTLTLLSSPVGHRGHAKILHFKKLDAMNSGHNDADCMDIEVIFNTALFHSKNLQKKVVFCQWLHPPVARGRLAIFSTYFTTGRYSQYGHSFEANNFRFMKRWFLSGSKLGATLVIFHDNLNEQFQKRVKDINSNVEFVKVTKFGPDRTPNDGRFFVWYEYLVAHPDIEAVLVTDIRDVHFLSNPFTVMNEIGNYLYLGVDNAFYMNAYNNNGVRSNTLKCHANEKQDVSFYIQLRPFYNAGVVGGRRKTILNFFQKIIEKLNGTPRTMNCNMGTYAYVAGKYFFHSSFTGYPFQSAFKIGLPGPTNLAVKHKVFPGNNVYDESID